MLPSMPYFLEYRTDLGAGRVAVESTNLGDAVAKARAALRGLECTSAVLRHTTYPFPVFGEGPALAAFTRDEGWMILEPRASSE